MQNAIRTALISAALALALGACGLVGGSQTASTGNQQSGGSGNATPGPGFTKFSDIPMPANNTIDLDRSLILGGDQQWTGRLVINSGSSVADMYEFYRREMPNFGWQEVTTVRAANSVLVFQQGPRVATIQIAPNRGLLGGATVDMTMAPRGGGAAPPQRTSYEPDAGSQQANRAAPPLPPVRRPAVESNPLPVSR
ncbi:MAG: hypothetical protein HY059_12730 [Proteobacteria bacterium]|nr:hypothetical protein [Pseudomonadota bacterium]